MLDRAVLREDFMGGFVSGEIASPNSSQYTSRVAGDDVIGPMFDGKFSYGLRDIRGASAPQMAWLLLSDSSQRPPVCSAVTPFLPPRFFARPERWIDTVCHHDGWKPCSEQAVVT